MVGLHSWWLSSTTTTKKRSSTGVNFLLQFWGNKNSSSECKHLVEKKNKCDDKDVGQGGYVGENRDPDYRRYEQASHLDIMITYYHYYYHILWAGEPDRYQPYHLLHHQSQDFSSALALRFHILDIWKSLWNCDHNNCDCESTGQWGNSGGNFTSSWAGSVAQNCL